MYCDILKHGNKEKLEYKLRNSMNFFKQIFQSDLLHGKRTKIFLFKCLGLGKFFSIQNCQLPNQRRKNWMKRDRIPKTCKIYLDRSFNCLKKVKLLNECKSQFIFKVQIKTKDEKDLTWKYKFVIQDEKFDIQTII